MPGSAQRCQLGCGEHGAHPVSQAECASPCAVLATVGAHPVPPTHRSTTTCGASSARSTRTTASLTSLSASGTALTGEHLVVRLPSAPGCWLWFGQRAPWPLGSPFPGLWPGAGSGQVQQGPPAPAHRWGCLWVPLSPGQNQSHLSVTHCWRKTVMGLASGCQNLGIMSIWV